MRNHSVLDSPDGYRGQGTAARDPDRKDVSASLLTIFVLTLAAAATGAGIVLIDRIGTCLSP